MAVERVGGGPDVVYIIAQSCSLGTPVLIQRVVDWRGPLLRVARVVVCG